MKRSGTLLLTASLLSACGDPDRRAYEDSVDCAANELALHQYIEQARSPDEMALADDRQRFAILLQRARQAGRRVGRDGASARVEIERRVRAARERDDHRPISAAVDERFTRARQCLASPGGSVMPLFGGKPTRD